MSDMAKSFCNGCRHWIWYKDHPNYDGTGFHYCSMLETWELKKRKELCGGKYKEE